MIKLPLRNGQENGLRSRGLVHPEHALCLAELSPDEIGRATDAEDEQVTKERFLSESNSLSSARRWCSEKDLNPHLLVRSQPLYPLNYPNK